MQRTFIRRNLPQRKANLSFRSPSSAVTGEHWTGSPKKSIDQIGKNCPKNVRKLCFRPLRTIFGFHVAGQHRWIFVGISVPSFLGMGKVRMGALGHSPNGKAGRCQAEVCSRKRLLACFPSSRRSELDNFPFKM